VFRPIFFREIRITGQPRSIIALDREDDGRPSCSARRLRQCRFEFLVNLSDLILVSAVTFGSIDDGASWFDQP
jgi:hypothetical protein